MTDIEPGARLADRGNLKIVYRRLSELRGYERNSRTHSDEQLTMIAESMKQFGWTSPLLIDETSMIIAGHGRAEVAKRLGLTTDIPCIVLDGLAPEQKQALVVADNALAAKAGWDFDLLASEISEILDNGIPLLSIGFNDQDLAQLLGGSGPGDGLTDPDDTPAVPMDPVSVPGDVWLMEAKVICPRCAKSSSLEKAVKKNV